MLRADYTYSIEQGVICIVDLDKGNRSVTNDIENILAEIAIIEGRSIINTAVIYRDSDRIWDAVEGYPGVIRFVSLAQMDKEEAIKKYLTLYKAQ